MALWPVVLPLASVTGKLRITLTLSPGVTKPPTAWFWSRLRVIACEPFGIAPETVLMICEAPTHWSDTRGVPV